MDVQTVTGVIDSADLGTTLMHEHVFLPYLELRWEYPDPDVPAQNDLAVDRLRQLRDRGIGSIVDLTVLGLGRFVPRIRQVAEETGMQIVVATGIYTFNELPGYFRNNIAFGRPEFMSDFFVREIEEGIGDTGIRPGMLKVATDHYGVTDGVDTALRAVARAHRRTGTPISTHTHSATRTGLDQQRIFAEEGVDLTRVVIGHCGDSTDIDYLVTLMEAGSFIGMDRFGLERILSFEDRVATVAKLCQAGFADHMVLSHDAACHSDNLPEDMKTGPDWAHWQYNHIHDEVLPKLRELGVTDDQIDTMMVKNPRRLFERKTSY